MQVCLPTIAEALADAGGMNYITYTFVTHCLFWKWPLVFTSNMTLHYYPLVNKIVTTLNLRDKLNIPTPVDMDATFTRPFVTVAREPGSGGRPIAKLVAEKLGFEFIDEKIIRDIAASTKQRREIIKAIDEKSRGRIEDIIHSALNTEYMDDIEYITELGKVLLYYAHKGKVVIVGRGANFITPFAKGLHVNITAPFKLRVQRAMEYEGLNSRNAQKLVKKIEKERCDFVKQYLKQDVTKSNAYDLTINTSFYTLDQASNVIAEAFYQKFSRSERYKNIFS